MTELASAHSTVVLAPNPGPMTLEGTNTYVVGEPGVGACIVVDPGPDDPRHVSAVLAAVGERDARVAEILLTHGHPDHSAGARTLAQRVGAPVRALDPRHTLGGEGLAAGDVVATAGVELEVLATPGHSADHLCFVLRADGAVLTGDHVLGRGTTVVAHPDGNMRDYLDSLRRLADVGATVLLPGHGPRVDDAAERIAYYLAHRAEREQQIVAALRAGARTAADVVRIVYADVDAALHGAAELSVRAHLDLLVDTDRVRRDADDGYRISS